MTFYSNLATRALALLTKYGKALTLTHTTPGTFDPVTGSETGDTTATYTVQGIALTIDNSLRAQFGEIQTGDRVYMLDGVQEPKIGDTLTLGSEPWPILDVKPINPAGTALAYTVQLRK